MEMFLTDKKFMISEIYIYEAALDMCVINLRSLFEFDIFVIITILCN